MNTSSSTATFPRRPRKVGGYKEKMTSSSKALDIVMQQLLKSEYGLFGVHVSELRSDAKGVLGLRTACKQLAQHDARQWMGDMACCIAENLDLVRTQNPQPRFSEYEVFEMMREKYGDDWEPPAW